MTFFAEVFSSTCDSDRSIQKFEDDDYFMEV